MCLLAGHWRPWWSTCLRRGAAWGWTGLDWTGLRCKSVGWIRGNPGSRPYQRVAFFVNTSRRCCGPRLFRQGGVKTRDPERNTLWLARPYGPILSHGTTHALGGIHYHIPGIGRSIPCIRRVCPVRPSRARGYAVARNLWHKMVGILVGYLCERSETLSGRARRLSGRGLSRIAH